MIKLLFLLGLIFIISCTHDNSQQGTNSTVEAVQEIETNQIKEGDIIFHTSKSSQSLAIQKVTKSRYSHMGIIFKDGNQFYVYEAIQPVSKTPLQSWINRGEEKHFVIKRLKDTSLSKSKVNEMKVEAHAHFGKAYDLTFEWTDDKMYCSEYVWKIYKEVLDIEIGALQQLKEFDLSIPLVQQKVKERYGDRIPMEEKVISPERMFQSSLLHTVDKPLLD